LALSLRGNRVYSKAFPLKDRLPWSFIISLNLLKPVLSLLSDLATNDADKAKNEDDDSSDGDGDDDDDENVKNSVDIDDLEVLLENRLSAEGVDWKEPGTREY
jgi:hypothetical protein